MRKLKQIVIGTGRDFDKFPGQLQAVIFTTDEFDAQQKAQELLLTSEAMNLIMSGLAEAIIFEQQQELWDFHKLFHAPEPEPAVAKVIAADFGKADEFGPCLSEEDKAAAESIRKSFANKVPA